jgi:rhodanese-related sulfurtransferase
MSTVPQEAMPAFLAAARSYLEALADDFHYVTAEELAARLDRDPDSVYVLDNRTPEAYSAGHVPGANNAWLPTLLSDDRLDTLPRDKQIVVCCWVGHTASQVVVLLRLLGFDAVGLKYGMGTPRDPSEKVCGWVDGRRDVARDQ